VKSISIFVSFAVAITSLAGGATPAPVEMWPQWRGPERTGAAPGPAWPDRFNDLQQLWRVELDKGYSGPIVSADRVFVFETSGGDTELVRALDRATGREMWRASWPGKISVPFYAKRSGDWVRSTPAFDGKTLYVGGMEEVLVALDARTGKERWRVDFPQRFKTAKPDFGFASSPLVDGSYLYVQAANSMVKLDAGTGATIWRKLEHGDGVMESGAFSSPLLAKIAGRRQLLVQTRTHLHGLDPETGSDLWSQFVPNFRGMNILTPAVHGDSVFTSTYQNESYLFQVRATQNGGFEVKELWRNKAKGYMSTPIVQGGMAYLHLGNQRFTCIDLQTGVSRWTSTPFGRYWSMVLRGDKILALDENGTVHLVRTNADRFELLDSKELTQSEAWGHIAVAGNELFIRELAAVTAYRWNGAPGATPAK
jgi:outer membrane protein assembly factor BamB